MSRRGLDLLHGEEVDMAVKPHPLSFSRYHAFFIYLVLAAFLLRRLRLLLKENISVLSILSFLDAALSRLGMDILDAVFLVSFWAVLIISGWIGNRLLHNRILLFYAILVAASGTVLELYLSMMHYEIGIVPIQRASVKLVLLAGTAIACMALVEVYRRRYLYVVTNYRVIIRGGLILKEEEIAYKNISRVYVKQGILGRIFNFGTVVLNSTFDFSEAPYREIPEALKMPSEKADKALEEDLGKWKRGRQLKLLGVPDPRRVRIIIGNRILEKRESPL